MAVSGTISQDELLAALQLERAGRRRGFLVAAAVAGLGGLAAVVAGGRAPGLAGVAMGIGLLLSEFLSARVLVPWKSRRLYGPTSAFRLPGRYDWTPTHFLSANERGEASLAWADVRDVVENERVFLVRHLGGRLQIVPKSWFGEEAMASFRAVAPVKAGASAAKEGAE